MLRSSSPGMPLFHCCPMQGSGPRVEHRATEAVVHADRHRAGLEGWPLARPKRWRREGGWLLRCGPLGHPLGGLQKGL
eukprot:8430911-Alexandrium_andersonii.AAC.1